MRFRNYAPKDADDLARVMFLAVRDIAVRYYSPEQCAAWCPGIAQGDAFVARLSDGRAVFVAADDTDVAQGFIELCPNGYIDRFYCAPEVAGRGVGQKLYQMLELQAQDWGLGHLQVEASEAARGFFLREGFQVVKRQEISRREVSLHNYRMEKTLKRYSKT